MRAGVHGVRKHGQNIRTSAVSLYEILTRKQIVAMKLVILEVYSSIPSSEAAITERAIPVLLVDVPQSALRRRVDSGKQTMDVRQISCKDTYPNYPSTLLHS